MSGGQDHAALGERAARTLVRALLSQRTTVLVSPGSRNTPLALAFDAHPLADTMVVLDERAAGFVALGAARQARGPAILVCTSGSAGAHYLPAILEARHARVPLLVLTADRPAELHHVGAHQTVDQTRLFGEHVIASFALPVSDADLPLDWLTQLAARARARCEGSPAGPVHLNVPFREPLWSADASALPEPSSAIVTITHGQRVLADRQLDVIAAEMASVERGVIVCGPLAPATQDERVLAQAVSRLAAELVWPVLAEPASGLRVGAHDRSTLVCGYDALLRHPPFAETHAADMVLRLGRIPTSKALGHWLARQTGRVTLLDPDGEWHDASSSAARLLVADPAATCDALAQRLSPLPARDRRWLDRWRRGDELANTTATERETLWEGSLARTVLQILPEGAQLHLGSSMPIRDVDGFGGSHGRTLRIHANRGVNGIDGTIACAAGEALGWTRGPTVALMGDLTFFHDLDGLAAASELAAAGKLPRGLTLVVVDNGGGGIFEHLPIRRHASAFERLFLTPQRADVSAVCAGLGIHHTRIDGSLSDAEAALGGAMDRNDLSVVHVLVDRDASVALHRASWRAVADALGGSA